MNLKYPELKLLSDQLKVFAIEPDVQLCFREESEADNRYALRVTVVQGPGEAESATRLARGLAKFWGCPEASLPEYASFEAADRWHGTGDGDLRELADELGRTYEPFFDIVLTVADIHEAANIEEDVEPVGAVILRLEPVYEEFKDSTATGHGDTVLQALAALERVVIETWGKESALSDNHLLQTQLDLEELGLPGACIEFSDMSCPEDAFILRRLYVDAPYRCNNCGHVDEYSELPPAKHLAERHVVGDTFSDVECPQCGALCFPAPEFKYTPE